MVEPGGSASFCISPTIFRRRASFSEGVPTSESPLHHPFHGGQKTSARHDFCASTRASPWGAHECPTDTVRCNRHLPSPAVRLSLSRLAGHSLHLHSRAAGECASAPCGHAVWMVTRCGRACSAFGSRMVSTPSLSDAEILSASTVAGRRTLRSILPLARSWIR
jgi:hypothetical protein